MPAKDDERNWRLHVLPRIGSYKVVDVSRADIAGRAPDFGGQVRTPPKSVYPVQEGARPRGRK